MPAERTLSERVIHVERRVEEINDDLRDIKHTVYGNGAPGMRIQLDRLVQNGLGHSRLVVLASSIIAVLIAGLFQVVAAWISRGP